MLNNVLVLGHYLRKAMLNFLCKASFLHGDDDSTFHRPESCSACIPSLEMKEHKLHLTNLLFGLLNKMIII